MNILACIGSGGAGLSFCCMYMVKPINTGQIPIIINDGGSHGMRPKRLKIVVGSFAARSCIHP